MEQDHPKKGYQVKDAIDVRKKIEDEKVGPKQYGLEYSRPQYVFEDHYDQEHQKTQKKGEELVIDDL